MDTNVPVRIISEMERFKSRYHSRNIAANESFPKTVCRIRGSLVYLYDSGQLARDLMNGGSIQAHSSTLPSHSYPS
jgi:hypothetical protein